MALYKTESKDRVRDAVDFVELVSARTELRRAGPARYEGLCPFHEERTPSFGIDPTQKVYYCFGCQSSGDLFTFVQETEGVDFRGALELLAERYGIELEREEEDPREAERRKKRERLLELLSRTAGYYERVLWESSEAAKAREYLLGRGLSEEILREFRVGYAPSAWDRVLLASRRGGFTEAELYATGLAQRSRENGRPYDRFRSRITFPLSDIRGRVLGFGARAMEDEDAAERGGPGRGDGGGGRRPKYLNTSDNDVYHKGLHLYGADLARAHAAKAGQVILCEGYTDVIALHQAGMRNAVGLMGTALTSEQVGELARMAQTVLMALDADTAGQEAMLRASALAAKRKLELRVVALPEGADPAELIQRDGPEAIASAVERSVPFVRFRVERVLAAGETGSPEGRDRVIEELRPVFATLPPSAMRMELTRLVSSRLALPESMAEQLLARGAGRSGARGAGGRSSGGGASSGQGGAATQARRGNGGGPGGASGGVSRREDTERAFLALCIAAPEEGSVALHALDVERDFSNDLLRRAALHLRDGGLEAPMAQAPGESAEEGSGPNGDEQLRGLLAELIVQAGGEAPNPGMLEVQRLQLELARLERGIQRARGQEGTDVTGLAREKAALKIEFDRAYARVLEETGDRGV
ncbi:MAG: primase [Solirubrobacterales bacterium]|nr:primase [Solirubrobacterales bacterium]